MIHKSSFKAPGPVFLGVQKPRIFFFGSLYFSSAFPFSRHMRPRLRVICCFSGEWQWVKKYINAFFNLLFCGTHMIEIVHIKYHGIQLQDGCQGPKLPPFPDFSLPLSWFRPLLFQPIPLQWSPAVVPPWSLLHFHIWFFFMMIPVIYSFYWTNPPPNNNDKFWPKWKSTI